MSSEFVELEADSLEQAEEQLKAQLPVGLGVLVTYVLSGMESITVQVIAETVDEAFAKAQGDIPHDAVIRDRKVFATPTQKSTFVKAFDEVSARTTLESQAGVKVKSLKFSAPGNKGFLGLGKKPNQYEAEIIQHAVIEITFGTKLKILALIGEPATVSEIMAAHIWIRNRTPFDKLDNGVQITLGMYGWAIVAEEKRKVEAARKSEARIDVSDVAFELFRGGMHVIAADVYDSGGNFSEFRTLFNVMFETYQKEWMPVVDVIKKGEGPVSRKRIFFIRDRDRLSEVTKNDRLRDIETTTIYMAMKPLVEFVNSYALS
jgi:hypothetical protein